MSIPEGQLTTWANQGAVTTAKLTHESVRTALSSSESPIADRISNGSVQVYLQGSYKNDTNIRGDSDVDIVVELNATFHHNAHELPQDQRLLHDASYEVAKYPWAQFRSDVVRALESYYGSKQVYSTGNKSIKLLPGNGRLSADIVPVTVFRQYSYFGGSNNYSAREGVRFQHLATGREIVNFPKHHYDNGVDKNSQSRTNGWFKPTVRIFKNARTYLVGQNKLKDGVAPSYFLQGLIYNMPDNYFGGTYNSTVYNILCHLYKNPIDQFVCQNGIHNLFGSTEEQWNLADAQTTIKALVELWDSWK